MLIIRNVCPESPPAEDSALEHRAQGDQGSPVHWAGWLALSFSGTLSQSAAVSGCHEVSGTPLTPSAVKCSEERSASPLLTRQITCAKWDGAFVFAQASGCTVGPYCDIVLSVPVVSLQDPMESLRSCQASWLAGGVENVGTEKKKHVSTCR